MLFVLILLVTYGIYMLSGEPLREIPIYDLHDEQTYYLKADYCTIENEAFIMNGRCYCFSENGESFDCSSPGPTLRIYSNTTITIQLINAFENSLTDEYFTNGDKCHNGYCDMDVTNLHTHGLHISVTDDDVLKDIYPGETYSYTFHIPSDHHPGILWYHPHNHGSVSHQIQFGLFGALITEYSPDTTHAYTNFDERLCDNIITEDPNIAYIRNILVFSHVYAVANDKCDCSLGIDPSNIFSLHNYESSAGQEGPGVYGRCEHHGKSCFFVYSACYEYCAFEHRYTSSFQYNIEFKDPNIAGIAQYFLVNGQINPIIENIAATKFRRLRLVNAVTQYYIQYDLPDACDWYLLGYDGVYFNDGHRSLQEFNNEFILAPGSRADILFKCDVPNIYGITTTQNTAHSVTLKGLERAGSTSAGDITLFRIEIVKTGGLDTQTTLPNSYPVKPEYLKDLTLETEYDNICACNQYIGINAGCHIEYNSQIGYTINGETFRQIRYMTYMLINKVYDFSLKTDRHVHHSHIYPFQLQQDVENGFIAKKGDWFDTFGSGGQHRIRMYTANFKGYQVFHCHILPHEDMGMMGLNMIIDPHDSNVQYENDISECLVDLLEGGHKNWSLISNTKVGKEKGSKNNKVNALSEKVNSDYYVGLGGITFEDEGGILSNHYSLILLTIMALLMLFNTVMILKFQFCGVKQRHNRNTCTNDKGEVSYDDTSDETQISDLSGALDDNL